MAIATNGAVTFFGTALASIDSSSAVVADTAFSVAASVADWTNAEDAPMASMIFTMDSAGTPAANSGVNLYAMLIDIDGTTDENEPGSGFTPHYLGRFAIDASISSQTVALDVALPNTKTSQIYRFFIENQTGASIDAGWTLKISTKTIGPAA